MSAKASSQYGLKNAVQLRYQLQKVSRRDKLKSTFRRDKPYMVTVSHPEYHYQSHDRLQLIFSSPNHCATFLGMLTMVIIGVVVLNWERRAKSRLYFSIFSCAALIAGLSLLGLCLTYSRGGWVAFLGASSLLFIFSPRKRFPVLSFTLIFIGAMIFMPKGVDRINSIADTDDLSIVHRVQVWQGAMAMTADHWKQGVGRGQFGIQFGYWYQPLDMKTSYKAALNNYLTLSSECGIFALFIYLLIVIIPFWTAWRMVCINHNPWIQGVLAAQMVFCLSGLFTYSMTIWQIAWFYWLLWGITVAYAILKVWGKKAQPIHLYLWPPLLFSLIACFGILLCGNLFLHRLPLARVIKVENLSGWNVYPRDKLISGTILYMQDNEETFEEISRTILRPLAMRGFRVLYFDNKLKGIDSLETIQKLDQWVDDDIQPPVYLLGFGGGGRLGLVCASNEKKIFAAIATVGIESDWPFPQLSPIENIAHLNSPLMIVHGGGDLLVDPSNAEILKEKMESLHKSVELLIYPQAPHNLGILLPAALDQITDFFRRKAMNL